MVKAAWGKKHTCPKCGTRFYDLGKKGPAVCIECEHKWVPEQILKAKQVHVAPPKPVAVEPDKPADEAADKPAGDGDAAGGAGDSGGSGDAGDSGGSGGAGDSDGSGDVAAIKGLEVEVEDDGSDENGGVLGDVSLDNGKEDLSKVVDTKLEQGGSE